MKAKQSVPQQSFQIEKGTIPEQLAFSIEAQARGNPTRLKEWSPVSAEFQAMVKDNLPHDYEDYLWLKEQEIDVSFRTTIAGIKKGVQVGGLLGFLGGSLFATILWFLIRLIFNH